MSKKAIELSVNFLVTLIIAIVLFGMGIYLGSTIFGGGGEIVKRQFDEFDRAVGELACSSSDNVCINIKSKEIRRGDFDTLAVTIRNAIDKTDFNITIQNTKYISSDNSVIKEYDEMPSKLLLFGFDKGRIQTLDKREKKTFGVGVEVPKDAPSGQYVLTVTVYRKDSEGKWITYTANPYKMIINVP